VFGSHAGLTTASDQSLSIEIPSSQVARFCETSFPQSAPVLACSSFLCRNSELSQKAKRVVELLTVACCEPVSSVILGRTRSMQRVFVTSGFFMILAAFVLTDILPSSILFHLFPVLSRISR
jgi:ABC-type multidrug transport system permease subunit